MFAQCAVPSWQGQTIIIDNIISHHQTATTISSGLLCANVPQVWQPQACTGNSHGNQHHLETNKMGRGFLW